MAALLAPIAGAVVGTSLLYGIHAVQTARTDKVISEIEGSRSHVDTSRSHLLSSAAAKASAEAHAAAANVPTKFRSALNPTVKDELQERWNANLLGAVDVVSRIQWDIAASKAIHKIKALLPSGDEAAQQAQSAAKTVKSELSLR